MVVVWADVAGAGRDARGADVERMATATMHISNGSAEVSVHRIRLRRALGRRERKAQRVREEEFTVFPVAC